MNKSFIAILFLCSFLCVPVHAESIIVPITIDEAIETALKNRPEMSIAREKKKLEEFRLIEKKSGYLPKLDLFATSEYLKSYDDFTGINIYTEIQGQEFYLNIKKVVPDFQVSGGADLGWNLYSGGRDDALTAESLKRIDAVSEEIIIAERKIRLEVSKSFWELKKAQIACKTAENEFDLSQAEIKIAQAEFRAGRISEIEMSEKSLNLSEKETSYIDAKAVITEKAKDYLIAIGLTDYDYEKISKAGMLIGEPVIWEEIDNKTSPIEIRPEILHIKSEIEASKEKKKAAESEYLPKLDLFARYRLVGRDDAYTGSWESTTADTFAFGLKLTSNIFDGYSTKAKIDQTASEISINRLKLSETQRALELLLNKKKAALDKARRELSVIEKKLDLKRKQQKIAEARHKAGKCSEIELKKTWLETTTAENRLLIGKIDAELARLDMMLCGV